MKSHLLMLLGTVHVYSTAQKKANREPVWELVQNGYQTDIEWMRIGNGLKKGKKVFSILRRTRSSEHMYASKFRYQSAEGDMGICGVDVFLIR